MRDLQDWLLDISMKKKKSKGEIMNTQNFLRIGFPAIVALIRQVKILCENK